MKSFALTAFLTLAVVATAPAFADGLLGSLSRGDVTLESIGPIAFGPEGILFIADPRAAAVYALDSADSEPAPAKRKDVSDLDKKIAGQVGVAPRELIIHDFALHPISGSAYLSVTTGRGPDAAPILVRVTTKGKVGIVELNDVAFAKASLWPAPDKDRRGRDIRQDAITDMAYVDGSVVVAGLSNQEFSSRLRVLNFPFAEENWETGLEIYHTAHGQWETHSPIRTFTPFTVDEEPYILAAHTCTPLVRIPVEDILSSEDKVVGSTIAELGNRNRPLDMLTYQTEDGDFLLITNSSRGVMKLAMDPIPGQDVLTDPVQGTAGADIVSVEAFAGAVQVEAWGDKSAVALRKNDAGNFDLETLPLP